MIILEAKTTAMEIAEQSAELSTVERSMSRRGWMVFLTIPLGMALAMGCSMGADALEIPRGLYLIPTLLLVGGMIVGSIFYRARAENRQITVAGKLRKLLEVEAQEKREI